VPVRRFKLDARNCLVQRPIGRFLRPHGRPDSDGLQHYRARLLNCRACRSQAAYFSPHVKRRAIPAAQGPPALLRAWRRYAVNPKRLVAAILLLLLAAKARFSLPRAIHLPGGPIGPPSIPRSAPQADLHLNSPRRRPERAPSTGPRLCPDPSASSWDRAVIGWILYGPRLMDTSVFWLGDNK